MAGLILDGWMDYYLKGDTDCILSEFNDPEVTDPT